MKKEKVTPSGDNKRREKVQILQRVLFICASLLALWVISTLGVGLIRGNGINNYTGVKQVVANEAIATERTEIDNKVRWAYFIHVEEVRPTTQSEKEQYCQAQQANQNIQTSDDPADALYYTTKLSVREILGFKTRTVIYDGCQLFTQRFGGGARQGTYIDYGNF